MVSGSTPEAGRVRAAWLALAGYVLGTGMAGAPLGDRILRYLALAVEITTVLAFVVRWPHASWLLLAAVALRCSDLVRHAQWKSRDLASELERFYATDFRASMIHELEEGIDGCIHRLTQEHERFRRVWTARLDDPYAVLGVPPGAGAERVRRAYFHLVLKYHPDKVQGDDAKEMFLRVARAYRILSSLH